MHPQNFQLNQANEKEENTALALPDDNSAEETQDTIDSTMIPLMKMHLTKSTKEIQKEVTSKDHANVSSKSKLEPVVNVAGNKNIDPHEIIKQVQPKLHENNFTVITTGTNEPLNKEEDILIKVPKGDILELNNLELEMSEISDSEEINEDIMDQEVINRSKEQDFIKMSPYGIELKDKESSETDTKDHDQILMVGSQRIEREETVHESRSEYDINLNFPREEIFDKSTESEKITNSNEMTTASGLVAENPLLSAGKKEVQFEDTDVAESEEEVEMTDSESNLKDEMKQETLIKTISQDFQRTLDFHEFKVTEKPMRPLIKKDHELEKAKDLNNILMVGIEIINKGKKNHESNENKNIENREENYVELDVSTEKIINEIKDSKERQEEAVDQETLNMFNDKDSNSDYDIDKFLSKDFSFNELDHSKDLINGVGDENANSGNNEKDTDGSIYSSSSFEDNDGSDTHYSMEFQSEDILKINKYLKTNMDQDDEDYLNSDFYDLQTTATPSKLVTENNLIVNTNEDFEGIELTSEKENDENQIFGEVYTTFITPISKDYEIDQIQDFETLSLLEDDKREEPVFMSTETVDEEINFFPQFPNKNIKNDNNEPQEPEQDIVNGVLTNANPEFKMKVDIVNEYPYEHSEKDTDFNKDFDATFSTSMNSENSKVDIVKDKMKKEVPVEKIYNNDFLKTVDETNDLMQMKIDLLNDDNYNYLATNAVQVVESSKPQENTEKEINFENRLNEMILDEYEEVEYEFNETSNKLADVENGHQVSLEDIEEETELEKDVSSEETETGSPLDLQDMKTSTSTNQDEVDEPNNKKKNLTLNVLFLDNVGEEIHIKASELPMEDQSNQSSFAKEQKTKTMTPKRKTSESSPIHYIKQKNNKEIKKNITYKPMFPNEDRRNPWYKKFEFFCVGRKVLMVLKKGE